MKQKDKDKFGFYIVLINIIICLFMQTGDNADLHHAIVACISAVVAILFNISILIHAKKKILSILTLILNISILIALVLYTISKYHLI